MKKEKDLPVVEKLVQYDFTPEERADLTNQMLSAMEQGRELLAELDGYKSQYKSKIAECESKVLGLATQIRTGFTHRPMRCQVVFVPEKSKKFFYPAGMKPTEKNCVLVEDMTKEDFQIEFMPEKDPPTVEQKESLHVFISADGARGAIDVAKLGGKWYAAASIKIGAEELTEELTKQGKAAKHRDGALKMAVDRATKWIETKLGDEVAEGFRPHFSKFESENIKDL